MIKNLQEKFHQEYLNNQRVQKCEKCSKTFYKIFYIVLSKILNTKNALKKQHLLQGYGFL